MENSVENFPLISVIFSSHLIELLINKQIVKLYILEGLDAFLLKNWKISMLFSTQNGWIINESLYYEIIELQSESLLLYVTFLESIMEDSDCQCDQKSCYGRLRLKLNAQGKLSASN